jgi:AAA domain
MPKLEDDSPELAATSAATVKKLVWIRPRLRLLSQPREPNGEPPAATRDLPWRNADDVLAEAAAETLRWIAQEFMLEGQHGTLGGAAGIGKSWIVLDYGVSVATGGKWLGAFSVGQGKVVLFAAEGGKHEFARRTRAICRAKGVRLEGRLDVVLRAPKLTDDKALEEIGKYLKAVQPVLVIIDPMYLAQGGVNGKNLAEMGEMLVAAEELCNDAGATMLTVAHTKKTGNGNGMDQITGTGYQEWARVIAMVSVTWTSDPDPSDRHRRRKIRYLMEFFKGAEGRYLVELNIWSDDRHDPNSAMHYRAQVFEHGESKDEQGGQPGKRNRKQQQASTLLDVLDEIAPASTAELGERLGISKETVRRMLTGLGGAVTSETDPTNKQRLLYRLAASEAV